MKDSQRKAIHANKFNYYKGSHLPKAFVTTVKAMGKAELTDLIKRNQVENAYAKIQITYNRKYHSTPEVDRWKQELSVGKRSLALAESQLKDKNQN